MSLFPGVAVQDALLKGKLVKHVLKKLSELGNAIVDALHGGYLSKLDQRGQHVQEAVTELLERAHNEHDARQIQVLQDFLRDLKK